jgi:hypothetical protein
MYSPEAMPTTTTKPTSANVSEAKMLGRTLRRLKSAVHATFATDVLIKTPPKRLVLRKRKTALRRIRLATVGIRLARR